MTPLATTPSATLASMAAPPAPFDSLAGADVETAAREFAGLFYSMMVSQMQKSVPENSYFSSRGEEIFRSMWTTRMGRELAFQKNDPLVAAIMKEAARSNTSAAYRKPGAHS